MPPTKKKSSKALQGGRDVHSTQKESIVKQYFQTKLAVVEVRHGESQEDAWRRYLAENPDQAGAHVKIFHYPEPSPLKKNKTEIRSELPLSIRKENLV
jgi:hypothetical protein